MAEPKAYEPEKLTVGVTWKWKKTISDYPASEWTLSYYLRKDGAMAPRLSSKIWSNKSLKLGACNSVWQHGF